jgi:hypothetical protein
VNGLHEIYRGQGDQSLVHVPPFRVSSATYVIEDLTVGNENDPNRVIGSGAATVDTLSELLTATSGATTTDSRRINVVAPAAEAGHFYCVEAADGQQETHRLEGVAGTYVTAAGYLSSSYGVTARLRGIEISATFPAAAAARAELQEEERPLRVVWSYSIGGQLVQAREAVRVLRAGSATRAYLGRVEAMLREDWPELVTAIGPHASAVKNLVRSCDRELTAKLRLRGIAPDTFLAGDQGLEALLARCVWRFGERGHAPASTDIERWTEDAKRNYLNLWKAVTQEGAGKDTTETDRADDQAAAGSGTKRRRLIQPK